MNSTIAKPKKSRNSSTSRVRGKPKFFVKHGRLCMSSDYTVSKESPDLFVPHSQVDITDSGVIEAVAEFKSKTRKPKKTA